MSVEDFRRREIQMERELNRKVIKKKEKEKDVQVRIQLENMTPKINYTQPISNIYIGSRIVFTHRKKAESSEALDQIKREQALTRVVYIREGEIPRSPLESPSMRSYFSIKDIMQIPFFKAGSYPPRSIKIVEQQMVMNDDFMKVFQPPIPPPPPPPPHSMYPPLLPHASNPMGHSMMSMQSGMYPHHIPQPPPRVGPLPSAPIPQYNAMMPSVPMYDPSILANPMDPYSLMNKTRVLYNPVTKKPQNYRTVPCRRFHSSDGCERGDNCHFIHDFQYQGRPIPNFHDWKNNNMTRQRNLQGMNNYPMSVPAYYPPQGPEGHYEKR